MRIDGKLFSVWRARGPLWQRQIDASRAGCIVAYEQHMNAHTDPQINYSLALVDSGASFASKALGKAYTAKVAAAFGIADRGVVATTGRGSYNVRFYKCPCFLAEPGFISNAEFAARARTGEGIDALAKCLVDTIREAFPGGGLVALSVGHAYRGGKSDPGAPVNEVDVHDPRFDDEVEINEAIVTAAEEMLLAIEQRDTEPAPDIAPDSNPTLTETPNSKSQSMRAVKP